MARWCLTHTRTILVCILPVCCGVEQRVAVCRSVLQCVAVSAVCCAFICDTMYSRVTLQRVAVCCGMLQCVAVCCGVLRCVVHSCVTRRIHMCHCSRVAVCCDMLQCDAVCCGVLQCVARSYVKRCIHR